MSKDVKDTEAQEELKDKVNAGDVKEEKETKEKHAKAKKEDKDQKIEELGQKLSEINDKYLRLSAEFDNYRKRTLKERMELTKNAGNSGKNPACYGQFRKSSEKYGNGRRCAGFTRRS